MPRQRIGYALPWQDRHPRLAAFGEFLLVDVFGEIAFAIALCVVGGWAWAAFTAGWETHRSITCVALVMFTLFLGYGVWSFFAEGRGREPRWPRVAGAAGLTLLLLITYTLYLI